VTSRGAQADRRIARPLLDRTSREGKHFNTGDTGVTEICGCGGRLDLDPQRAEFVLVALEPPARLTRVEAADQADDESLRVCMGL
jgi:hypothetical protein